MFKLFRLGITDSIGSIMPIVMWMLIANLYGDSTLSDGFLLSYSLQAVFNLVYKITYVGNLNYAVDKHKDNYYLESSVLSNAVLTGLFIAVCVISADWLVNVLGFQKESVWLFQLSVADIGINWIVLALIRYMEIKDHIGRAFKYYVGYFVCKYIILIAGRVIELSSGMTLTVSLVVSTVYALIFYIREIKYWKLNIRIYKGFKYVVFDVIGATGMFIVLSDASRILSTYSVTVLTVWNMSNMCTDTQWDISESAVQTYCTALVRDSKYLKNRFRVSGRCFLYAVVVASTMFIQFYVVRLLPAYRHLDNVGMMLTFITFEAVGVVIDGIFTGHYVWLQINCPGKLGAILMTMLRIIRIVLQSTIDSVYAVSIAMLVTVVLGCSYVMIAEYYIRMENLH